MVPIQNIDFKELTGKIFKLNDLLPRWARKLLFILGSLRMCQPAHWDVFDVRSGLWGPEVQVSGSRTETLHEL